MISAKDFIFPALSVKLMPSLSIAVLDSLVGFAILVSNPLKDVPACEALIPLFAIRPSATETSSAVYPNEPATGATYLNDSPSMETLVFAFEDAAARTSAKCPASLACKPKAVRASVTMSEVVARSSPEAAARLMIPPIPSSISPVFQPAIAMYPMASAASEAENCVVAPISFALFLKASRSLPVAPEIAATFDIDASKSMPVFTDATPKPATAVVVAARAAAPIFPTAVKPPFTLLPKLSVSLEALSRPLS